METSRMRITSQMLTSTPNNESLCDARQFLSRFPYLGREYVTLPTASCYNDRFCDALSWDDYFMGVAFLSAMRSKDPRTQVGACIVNKDKRIVGVGYNGFPMGCDDDALPWARTSEAGDPMEVKYSYICHAEMNAILNKNAADVVGCTMYVALFPCNECAKLIIQSGIKRVMFLSDKYHGEPSMRASRRMLDMAGVEYTQYIPTVKSIEVKFFDTDTETDKMLYNVQSTDNDSSS